MSSASYTQQVLNLIDQIKERDFINCALAYKAICEKLDELYSSKISTENHLATKLREQIDANKECIISHNDEIAGLLKLIENNKTLMEEEIQLEEQAKKLKEKKKKIEILIQKKVELEKASNDFGKLDEEIINISLQNDGLVGTLIEKLNNVNTILSTCTTDMDGILEKIIRQTKENLQRIGNQSQSLLEKLDIKPQISVAAILNQELDDLITNYNKYILKINDIKKELEEVSDRYKEIAEQYRERYDKDKEIYGAVEEPAAFKVYLNDSLQKIDAFLLEFESRIKRLIEERRILPMKEIYEKQYDRINNKPE